MSDKSDADLDAVQSPGRVLMTARESANISVEDMAEQLNWLKSYVVAIEEDRYSVFSNQTFAKGYLKSYARRLGVEEQNLLDSYEALTGRETSGSQQTVETNVPTLHKSGIGKYIGLAVFLLVIVVLWVVKSGDNVEPSAVGINSVISDSSPAKSALLAEKQRQSGNAPSHSSSAAGDLSAQHQDGLDLDLDGLGAAARQSDQENSLDELVRDVAEVADQVQEDVDYSERSASEAVSSAPVDEVLYFKFFDECWLEVRDGKGDLIYADLRRSGDSISISGLPPFEILAGQAAAVELSYQNKLVPLKADSGRNSVRMRIGE